MIDKDVLELAEEEWRMLRGEVFMATSGLSIVLAADVTPEQQRRAEEHIADMGQGKVFRLLPPDGDGVERTPWPAWSNGVTFGRVPGPDGGRGKWVVLMDGKRIAVAPTLPDAIGMAPKPDEQVH